MKALVTKKVGMTSIITDNGAAVAVTLLQAEPHVVTQRKTEEIDGYSALQVGTGSTKHAPKPQQGHFKASGKSPKITKEFRIAEGEDSKVGDEFTSDVFQAGDNVDVTGLSKGKGFAGTIKRHNFHRGRKTHGGRSYRRPGSIGSMYPQRIFPGKKMAGQMGHEQITVKNLTVAFVDSEHQVIGVTGAVPGPKKGWVMIKGAKA